MVRSHRLLWGVTSLMVGLSVVSSLEAVRNNPFSRNSNRQYPFAPGYHYQQSELQQDVDAFNQLTGREDFQNWMNDPNGPKIEKKDSSGNPVLDDDNHPVMELARVRQYNKTLHNLNERVMRTCKGLELNDLIIRGIAGDNWEAVADLKTDDPLQAAGYIALFTGAGVFGEHLRSTIDGSLGDLIDSFFGNVLGGFSDACSWTYQKIRNFVLRRSGKPFTTKEIVLWRQSIDRILQDLEKVAQNLARIDARSRDKIARRDVDEDAIDPAWIGQRESFERQLAFWVQEIKKRKTYYNNNDEDAVLFYAEQIELLLLDIKENIIHNTKSSKDLGTATVQSALTMRKNTLDLYFFNMLTLIAPRTAQKEKDSANNRLKPNRDRYARRYDDDYYDNDMRGY